MHRALPFVLLLALSSCENKPAAPPAAPGSVGGALAIKGPNLIFSAVYQNSPAAKAGIKPGDRILKIDGLPTNTMNMEAAKASFKGAVGTTITLSVASGDAPPRDITLTRENVTTKIPMAAPAAPAPTAPAPAAPAPTAPAPPPAAPVPTPAPAQPPGK